MLPFVAEISAFVTMLGAIAEFTISTALFAAAATALMSTIYYTIVIAIPTFLVLGLFHCIAYGIGEESFLDFTKCYYRVFRLPFIAMYQPIRLIFFLVKLPIHLAKLPFTISLWFDKKLKAWANKPRLTSEEKLELRVRKAEETLAMVIRQTDSDVAISKEFLLEELKARKIKESDASAVLGLDYVG